MSFAVILAIAGKVMTGVSQYQEAQETAKHYETQAEIAKRRAKILEAEGVRGRQLSREEQREKRKEAREMLAKQIVLYAKSGVRPGVGTPELIGAYTEKQFAKEAAYIGEKGVWGHKYAMSQADIARMQGAYYKQAAKSTMRNIWWRIGATALTPFGAMSGPQQQRQFAVPAGGGTLATTQPISRTMGTYGRHFPASAYKIPQPSGIKW